MTAWDSKTRDQKLMILAASAGGALVLTLAVLLGVFAARGGDDGVVDATGATPSTPASSSPASESADATSTSDASQPTTSAPASPTSDPPLFTPAESSLPTTTAAPLIVTTPVPAIRSPLVEHRAVFDSGILIGYWNGTAWMNPPPEDPALFAGMTVHHLDGSPPYTPSDLSTEGDEVCGSYWAFLPPAEGSSVSVSGPDTGLTNVGVTAISLSAEHVQVLLGILNEAGLTLPSLESASAFRLDLQGDGVDELILQANAGVPLPYGSQAGDHSLTVLRYLGGGVVRNVIMDLQVTTGNETPVTGDDLPEDAFEHFINYRQFREAADLNGDGVAELLFEHSAWESGGVDLYDLTINPTTSASGWGCGV